MPKKLRKILQIVFTFLILLIWMSMKMSFTTGMPGGLEALLVLTIFGIWIAPVYLSNRKKIINEKKESDINSNM